MRGARRPASRKSARPTWMRRKGASGTCWRSSRIQETLGGRSSIETTLAVLRFRNRLVIEASIVRGCREMARSPCRTFALPHRPSGLLYCLKHAVSEVELLSDEGRPSIGVSDGDPVDMDGVEERAAMAADSVP